MRKRLLALLMVTAMGAVSLAGCAQKAEPTTAAPTAATVEGETTEAAAPAEAVDKVYIGFLNPLTGANADAGMQDLNACELAVKRINEAGGIEALGGAEVELVVIDSTSDSTQVSQILERNLNGDKVISGIVGTGISGLTLPVLPILEKYQVPAVTNSINDTITTSGYRYIFQLVPKGSGFGSQQVAYIKYLNEEEGCDLKKVAIVYENSSYGQSTAEGSVDIAEGAGLEVVLYEPFTPNMSDASSLVTAMKNSGADVILPVAYSQDAKLIVNTMKSMDYNPVVVAGGAGFLWPQLGSELGDAADGLVSVGSWNWDSKNIVDNEELYSVTQEYAETYGTYMTEHAGPSYAATWIIKDAIEKAANPDPKAVRDAIASIEYKDNMMQPGTIIWDEGGANTNIQAVMIQWQDELPRTVFPREYSDTKVLVPGRDY